MTEKLRTLLLSPKRVEVFRSVRTAFIEFIGPKTTSKLWETFSANNNLIYFRNSAHIRGSADELGNDIIDLINRLPDSDQTDAVLRLIQSSTETEIYPDSKKDLGLRD